MSCDTLPVKTSAGVLLPSGWTLKISHHFGTNGNIGTFAALHSRYYEGQYYNRAGGFDNNNGNPEGLVTIPNPSVIHNEQETYSHFEDVIAFSADHLTIQARGHADNSITSGEMVSLPLTTRSYCIEARYKIPNALYSWPAFWTYGDHPGHDASEIDVEQPSPGDFSQGVHQVSLYNHPTEGNIVIDDAHFQTQWMMYSNNSFDGSASAHEYTICYNDENSQITRYIDGLEIYQSSNWKWNASLGGTGYGPNASVIFNLAVGGSWPKDTPDPSGYNADLDLYSIEYYGP